MNRYHIENMITHRYWSGHQGKFVSMLTGDYTTYSRPGTALRVAQKLLKLGYAITLHQDMVPKDVEKLNLGD